MPNDKKLFSGKESKVIRNVLIVEGDHDLGDMLAQAIALETHCQPIVVTDGSEALSVVHTHKPDLLLVDYRLPRMNGIEFYDWLCTTIGLEDIPAIIMSAEDGKPKSASAQRYPEILRKPFSLEALLAAVARYVN